jgi:glycosyltransferase involved in cell wall biosynthesis
MKRNSIQTEVWHLINNSDPRRGGAQKILAQLASEHETILSKRPTSHWPLKLLPSSLLALISISLKLINRKPDIVYIHSRCFLPISWLLRALGSKAVFYAHANYRKYPWLYKIFPCNHYIAVSDAVREGLLDQNVEDSKISTITNPYIGGEHIGTCPFSQGSKFKFCFVGSLNSWKGIVEAVQAIYEASSSIKNEISLNIVGDGPLIKQLEELKNRAPKNVEIIISGYRDVPFEALKDSHILIIPSLEEGFGLVAIEGIYQGKIILYNKIPALNEICHNDPFSFEFDIHDTFSFLSAIKEAIESIDALSNIKSIKTRSEIISKKYSLESFAQKHQALREEIFH